MSQTPLDVARSVMVAQQIRTCEVLDERLLERLRLVPREDFVPEDQRAAAFADAAIPIGRGQIMFAPVLDARLVDALALKPADRVLEVGTGTGYLTAVMSGLARLIYTVEIVPEFKLRAAARLAAQGVANALLEVGDAARGWPRHAPYDAILVSGALPLGPDPSFRDSLAVGGRMVVIVGESPAMEARLITRERADHYGERSLFETEVPILTNAPERERFYF